MAKKGLAYGDRVHGFLQVEDRHDRWWRNLRGHIWFPLGPRRGPEGDDGWRGSLGGQWCHFHKTLRQLRLKVSTTGEETLDVAYGLGPFAQHWWHLELHRPAGTRRCYMLDKGLAVHRGEDWDHDRDCRRCGGTGILPASKQVRLPPIRFDLALGLTRASWCFGQDPQSWARNAPWKDRLRRNDLHWWKVGWYGRGKPETVDETTGAVNLPEGSYPVVAKLERRRWEVRVGPYRLTRRSKPWLDFYLPFLRRIEYSVEVDAAPAGGLPKPGKGENSWDCGQDHLQSIHCRVARPHDGDREWLASALAKATESVLRDRIRYGSGVEDAG